MVTEIIGKGFAVMYDVPLVGQIKVVALPAEDTAAAEQLFKDYSREAIEMMGSRQLDYQYIGSLLGEIGEYQFVMSYLFDQKLPTSSICGLAGIVQKDPDNFCAAVVANETSLSDLLEGDALVRVAGNDHNIGLYLALDRLRFNAVEDKQAITISWHGDTDESAYEIVRLFAYLASIAKGVYGSNSETTKAHINTVLNIFGVVSDESSPEDFKHPKEHPDDRLS